MSNSATKPRFVMSSLTGRWRLITASALMLFVQLALIRWSGANLLHLSYFSNLILLASFLGIGLGFLRASRTRDLSAYTPLLLLLLICFILLFPARIESSSSELIFFTSVTTTGLPAWISLPAIFLVTTVTMTGFGEITGRAFKEFQALTAYRWDITGSILGSVAFTTIAFFWSPPWVWSSVTLVAFFALFGKRLPLVSAAALILIVTMLVMESGKAGVMWSPYYKISTKSVTGMLPGSNVVVPADKPATDIWVNGIPHQLALDATSRLNYEPIYGTPYQRKTDKVFENVLIIGAGSGSDVAIALREGAKHVDAVEIDPRILKLGQDIHPDKPYADPRVTAFINDGRAFVSNSDKKYDLVLFALTDSLTLVSGASQLRLESYLFTKESLEAVKAHLTPNGMFAMYNMYRQPWLVDRLAGTITTVFGHEPCVDTFDKAATIASLTVGLQPDGATCASGATWKAASSASVLNGEAVPAPATDNWPFLYLKEPGIPTLYLTIILLVLLTSVIGIRVLGGPFKPMRKYLDLFFMGVAFLLLETKSVTTFALLFGTTWMVNALVFVGVLLAVLLAIEVTNRLKRPLPSSPIVLALFATLALSFVIPNSALLSLPVELRAVAAVALAFAPIFFANLLFTARFKDTDEPNTAFAANLFGAMVGGCLEYLSLLTGYQNLLIVAAVIYGAAIAFSPRRLN